LVEALPHDTGLFPDTIAPGTIVDVASSLGAFAVRTGDGSLLVTRFAGVPINALDIGERLEGADHEVTRRRIVERYPAFISDDVKGIRRGHDQRDRIC
jgi:hypothetical protein